MAVLPIRLYPDPVLREAAAEVDVVDDSVRALISSMRETMVAAPGIGLAAPQVGVQRRVLVYDLGEEFHALVNPEILEREGEETEEEGCLSIPELTYPVTRARWVRLRGLDEHGREVVYETEDLEARVVQHEVDHLDGILFIERIDPELQREARRILRERTLATSSNVPAGSTSTPPL